MKIIKKTEANISDFVKEVTSVDFLTLLLEDFTNRCGEDFLFNESIKTIAEEISVTLNFSYSFLLERYLLNHYEPVQEAGDLLPKEDAMDAFITSVIELDSPFDHPIVSQDDELFDALVVCAKELRKFAMTH